MSANPLVLVDGSSYLYRAFHALPPLSTATRPADRRRARRRQHALQAARRAQARRAWPSCSTRPARRSATTCTPSTRRTGRRCPTSCARRSRPLLEAIEAMGIPLLRIEGVEADDVIGTLAQRSGGRRRRPRSSRPATRTSRSSSTTTSRSSTRWTTRSSIAPASSRSSASRPSRSSTTWRSSATTSDNIPGVPGVGPKTAAKWLQQYRDLDTLKAQRRRGRRQDRRAAARVARRARPVEAARDDPLRRRAAAQASTISRCGRRTPRGSARCSSGSSSRGCCGACAAATPAPQPAAPRGHAPRREPRAARAARRPLRDRPRRWTRSSAGAHASRLRRSWRSTRETTSLALHARRARRHLAGRRRPARRPTFRSRIAIPARPIS